MKVQNTSQSDVFVYVKGLSLQKLRWWIAISIGVASLWLGVEGQWQIIVLALSAGLLMPVLYKVITWPVNSAIPLLMKDILKKKRSALLLHGLVSSLYSGSIISLWIAAVHHHALLVSTAEIFIPITLLGYSTAVGPIAFMLENVKEDKNLGISFLLMYASLVYIIIALLTFLGISFYQYMWIPILFYTIVTLLEEQSLTKKKKIRILTKNG